MPADIVKIGRALISVSDKAGLVDLGQALAVRGVEILSTGGTAAALGDAGLPVVDVAQVTGFPEMMDGRVKTLHPRIHGGLLAVRADPSHQAAMLANGIAPIDLLIVNLYPFEATLRARRLVRGQDREHRRRRTGHGPGRGQEPRGRGRHRRCRRLCRASRRDRAHRRRQRASPSAAGWRRRPMPARRPTTRRSPTGSPARSARRPRNGARSAGFCTQSFGALRYGENPHQSAALYLTAETRPGVATARQVQGKELSYNNINDTDAAYELVAEFDPAGPRGGRDHQARQPLRGRGRGEACSTPTRRRWPATRCRRSAASSR